MELNNSMEHNCLSLSFNCASSDYILRSCTPQNCTHNRKNVTDDSSASRIFLPEKEIRIPNGNQMTMMFINCHNEICDGIEQFNAAQLAEPFI